MRRVAVGLLCAGVLAAQRPPVAAPERFETILWMHGGPARDARLAEAIRALSCTAVSVSADEDPSWPGAHGLRFYRDQAAGKGILELRDADWHRVRDAYLADRDPQTLVRPHVLAQSATTDALVATLNEKLSRALPQHPIAASLGDEISVTTHANPLDLCMSDATLAGFRAFVRQRLRDVDALATAYGVPRADFATLMPATADQIRAREFQTRLLPASLRPWAEHREFMDAELARVVDLLLAQTRAAAPTLPVGLTGIQPPSAYGGHDYRRLLPGMTFYEAYDIGGARDLAQCFAPKDAWQVATLFAPPPETNASEYDGRVRAALADAIAHGMAGVVVWCTGDVLDGDATPTRFGTALRDAIESLRGAADRLAGATVVRAPVWIVESQASVRVWWMLDAERDGATWIQRLSSHEATHSTSQAARRSWLRLFEDLGLQPEFVADVDLRERLAAAPPRLLVLPATIALSDAACAAVTAYATGGGHVLADHSTAIYDEHGVRRATAGLDATFGIAGRSLVGVDTFVREGRASARGRLADGVAAAEAAVHGAIADTVGEHRIHVERAVGRGRAVYLNLAVCEYASWRLDPARHEPAVALRRRVRSIVDRAGVEPPVLVRGAGLPTCIERLSLRDREGQACLAIRLNALDAPELLAQLATRPPREVEVVFPRAVALTDLRTGAKHAKAASHRLTLDPWSGIFVAVSDDR